MKTLLILMMFAYSLIAVDAMDAAFALDYEDNYQVALSKAKKENKLLMLIVVQNPCPYCSRLVEGTLEDLKVKEEVKNFIPLIVDKRGAFPEALKGTPVPMTYFIDPKIEKSIYDNLGYLNAEDFTDLLKTAHSLRVRKI